MKKYTLKKRIPAFLTAVAITFTLSSCSNKPTRDENAGTKEVQEYSDLISTNDLYLVQINDQIFLCDSSNVLEKSLFDIARDEFVGYLISYETNDTVKNGKYGLGAIIPEKACIPLDSVIESKYLSENDYLFFTSNSPELHEYLEEKVVYTNNEIDEKKKETLNKYTCIDKEGNEKVYIGYQCRYDSEDFGFEYIYDLITNQIIYIGETSLDSFQEITIEEIPNKDGITVKELKETYLNLEEEPILETPLDEEFNLEKEILKINSFLREQNSDDKNYIEYQIEENKIIFDGSIKDLVNIKNILEKIINNGYENIYTYLRIETPEQAQELANIPQNISYNISTTCNLENTKLKELLEPLTIDHFSLVAGKINEDDLTYILNHIKNVTILGEELEQFNYPTENENKGEYLHIRTNDTLKEISTLAFEYVLISIGNPEGINIKTNSKNISLSGIGVYNSYLTYTEKTESIYIYMDEEISIEEVLDYPIIDSIKNFDGVRITVGNNKFKIINDQYGHYIENTESHEKIDLNELSKSQSR